MTYGERNTWLLLAVHTLLGCSVPDLQIIETSRSAQSKSDAGAAVDTQAARTDAGMAASAAPPEKTPERDAAKPELAADSGMPMRTTRPATMASPAQAGMSGTAAEGGSGGGPAAGSGGSAPSAQAGSSGSAAKPPCVEWKRAHPKDPNPPERAIEGGREETLTTPARQYICRVKPAASPIAVPGKVMFGSGCFVVYQNNGKLAAYSAKDEPIEVLVAAPGCRLIWQKAITTALAPDGLELAEEGQPSTYACRGRNPGVIATGLHIGHTYPSTKDPQQTECWYELLGDPAQNEIPTEFEMLTLER